MSARKRNSSFNTTADQVSEPSSPLEGSETETSFKKKKDELEIFQDRIKEIKYEREDVQKKTFGKWINSMLAKGNHPLVNDLFSDLRDGTKLLALLEVLTNKQYKRERGRMRVHHLNNVSRALQVLQENNVRLVNISNNEIVDGNAKITLALAWSVFLHWQVNDIMKHLMAATHQSNLEKALLSWCQTNTKPYPGVDIKNFSTSWSDGLAFAALIHRWRPEIIDFAAITSKTDPNERLDAAFKVAQEVLGIERLLDPEDVNTAVPDKKSVMMYVMCLFQALAHSGIDPPPLPTTEALEEEIKQEVAKLEAESIKPPSDELTSYQNIVEGVLSWLLVAGDRVVSMDEISEELNQVKSQFQEHEKFMLSLTEHQGDVGEVLSEGSRLLQESKMPANEIEEVRVQMKLLNTKWEDLRLKAMDRQNLIHEKLMSLQLAELEALKEFLTATEDRISQMISPPLDDLDALEENLKQQQKLHDDILKQQQRVVSFSNLVVVVDESNQDSEFANMEDQLSALSERWTHICGWTEKRGKLLLQLRDLVPEYVKKQTNLENWLQAHERKLKEIEANPNDTSDDTLMERYDRMQLLQAEMEEKLHEISDLQSSVQKLADESDNAVELGDSGEQKGGISGAKFFQKIESLQDRWEALSQIMEAQSQRMSKYGVQPKTKTNPSVVVDPTNIEMVDIVGLSRQQDFPKAKRTKIMNEWENSYGQVKEWVTRTETLIEVSPGSQSTTFDELSVDEQLILWEDLESELTNNEPVYKQALKDSDALIEYMKQENQVTDEVEAQVASLSATWSKVHDILTKRKLLIDFLLVKKQLQNEISTMTTVLTSYEKWLDNQGEISPISNQPRKLLEQCRVKKKTIHSHEGRVNKIKNKLSEINSMPLGKEDKELNTEVIQFTSMWDKAVQRLDERLEQLENMNQMSAAEKYTESSQLILQWINSAEGFTQTGDIKLTDLPRMKALQEKLNDYLEEAKKHEPNLETISTTSRNNQVQEDMTALEDLKARYTEVKAILEERATNLATLISKLELWQAEASGLESWLEEVDVFVCAETPAVGDADVLDAQLEQSNALEEDVETLSPKFNGIITTGKAILLEADDSVSNIMKARILKLTLHWNETVRKAKEQNIILKDAYEKTTLVLRGIGDTTEWLTQLHRDTPKMGSISSPSDLARLTRKFQALKDRVDKKEESFRLLNDRGNELLLLHQTQCKEDSKRAATIQDLAKNFTTLNSRWTEVTGSVDKNYQLLKDASFLYGEFRSLNAQEMDWLDRLEKKLKKPVTAAADMEELSEDLDDIEQYVGNQQEARIVKLQNIGRKLVEDGILVNSIQADVQKVTNRWTQLNQQAETRKTELESEMTEALQWEKSVQQLFEGLECSDKILTARLEHDLSAEDLPNDTQQLCDELKQQRKILDDMSTQVEVYRSANKLEAASRLEEQRDMLQDRFEEVQSKFTKFSCPSPESKIFAKIERIWRSLRQVEQALCFLELASDDPEGIQGQLNHCTKEYATLSDMKKDVENVLREGRRQVEDKKADSKLTIELDNMKALYNKLGMQIANIRNSLEKGLTVSTQMNEQMTSLELWLEQTELHLGGQFQDTTSEMDFLRGRTEELPRWTSIIDDFDKNYANFLKLVDPVLLDNLKERRSIILQKWDLTSHEVVRRFSENLKDVSVPELEIKQQKLVNDLEEWIDKAERFLSKVSSETLLFSDDEILELQALNEDLTERSVRLETLRDETIDLIVAKGDPFSIENPENLVLQKVTQRLESIGNQLQNLSSCIVLDDDEPMDFEELNQSAPQFSRQCELSENSGICNPAFDSEDDIEMTDKDNSIEVEVPLPQKTAEYTIEELPEVSVTLSRTGPDVITEEDSVIKNKFTPELVQNISETENNIEEVQEDASVSVSTLSDASTVIPGSNGQANSRASKIPTPERKSSSVSAIQLGDIASSRNLSKSLPVTTKTSGEGNIKIVEIKSNEIIQGILRMEPKIGRPFSGKEKMAVVKIPVVAASRTKGSNKSENDSLEGLLIFTKTITDQFARDIDSMTGNRKDKEIYDFEKECFEISHAMTRMAKKLQDIDKDSDPRRRVDALEIELSAVEPDVVSAISKGDSLVFKISKFDIKQANQIRTALDILRSDWLQLKTRAESQRFSALRLEALQLECQTMIQQLSDWTDDFNQSPSLDRRVEIKEKSSELQNLRAKIHELQKRNIRNLDNELENLERNWPKTDKSIKGLEDKSHSKKTASTRDKTRVPTSQHAKVMRKAGVPENVSENKDNQMAKPRSAIWSAELVTKVNRLREQISALSRNLASTDDALSIKNELEKLNPKVQEFEVLEEAGIKGSPEQVLQAKRVIQKVLDEWATINITVGQMMLRSPPSKSPSPGLLTSPETSDIFDLESWLDDMEEMLKEWKSATTPSDEAKQNLKDMESKVSKRHRSVMLLMSKKSRMSPASDDASRKIETIGYRWRNLLAEMTIRRDRLCGETGKHRFLSKWWEPQVVLRDWIQRATEAIEAPVKISDETALRNSLSNLKSLEHEIIGKKPDLEKLRQTRRQNVTEEELEEFKNEIEKLNVEIPAKRKLVEQKLMSLRKLTSQLDLTTSWVLEVRAQMATAKHRPPQEKNMTIESIMIRIETKENEVLEVIRNFINLEKECEANEQLMTPVMLEKIHQLKEDWLYVKSRGEINILTPAAEKKFLDYSLVTMNAIDQFEGDKEDTDTNSPDFVDREESNLETCTALPEKETENEEETLTSTSLSPIPKAGSTDFITEINELDHFMTLNLKSLKQQTVVVGDVDDIRNVLEKQKIVLRELELKKPQLDELMQTAENLKSESTRHNLHGKVSKLREHWVETNQAVVNRKTELEQCLSNSFHWDCQLKEADTWLERMESRVDHAGHTSDLMDDHVKEQKNVHADIHQFKKKMEAFQQLTQHLIASYQQDDTSRLKRATEQINQRYNHLNNSVISRGRALHAAQSSLSTIDRQLDAQLSWLSGLERALDTAESDVQRVGPNPPRDSSSVRNALQKIKELQTELEGHAATVAALGGSGRSMAAGIDRPEDAAALLRRLDEMNHRWHALKQRSMAIRNRLESNTEHWHALLLSLREIIEWVIRKDTELTALGPLGGDVLTLQHQMDDHRAFRRQLESKRPVIETNLISGRQHVANEPPVPDSDNETGKDYDGDSRGYRNAEAAAVQLTRSIRREVTKLSETWIGLLSRSDTWQMRLEEAIQRMRLFQQMLDDGSARLATAEAIKSRWPTIAAAADKSTLLDQLKTFREHISSTQRAVNDVNDHAANLAVNNILLSSQNVHRMDDLNIRLKNLQLNAKEREQELGSIGGGSAVASVIAVIPPSSNASVEPPWERALTSAKVPYYINHETETTQWDHPVMSDLLNSLTMYNDVRFSAYRTALKLRAVQKEIRLDKLPLKLVVDTFDSLGLRGHNDRLLDVPDMVSTLSTLYNTRDAQSGTLESIKGGHIQHDLIVIPLIADLALNWLLNVYDSQRTGQIRNLSFKIGVVLLSKGPMEDKFRYLFRLVADVSKQVDQRKLGLLLHDCMQIPRQLGEVAAFGGSNIEPSVRSCFEKAQKDKNTIEVANFLEWVKQEPQSLVWLPVLHRIAAAEGARHQAKCNVCKQVPILGLRYRCLKCFNFDMCQRCFFSGKKSKNHKLTHPMQEYCTESTSGEDVRDFTRALKNRFKSKRSLQKHRKLGYLPVQTLLEGDTLESPVPSPQHSLSPDIHSRVDTYASRLADVEIRNRSNSTPDSEDEHSLIAQYCQSLTRGDGVIPRSPIQIVAAIDAEQSEQLEAVIRALEDENASLQAEYDRLKNKSQANGQGTPNTTPSDDQNFDANQQQNGRSNYYSQIDSNENNIIAEARLLRQHKGRLEARMQILEDHNRQLEVQLQRLRQLLDEPKPNSPSKTGTLQSKSVVAAELATDSPLPQRANGHHIESSSGHWHQSGASYTEEVRPPPPPTPGYSAANEDLMNRAGDLGRAMGELVTAMNDEHDNLSEADYQRSGYTRPKL